MSEWKTVTKQDPCPICEKPDWCGVHESGAVRCMRIQSDNESNGGWIHNESENPLPRPPRRHRKPRYESPAFDAPLWWRAVRFVARPHRLTSWAAQLGLPTWTIDHMGACTIGGMLCFPMYDGRGRVCGIRTRSRSGNKWAIEGSKAGVFLPTWHDPDLPPMVCEGPTDSCAAMAFGYEPIGRPSCSGSVVHVIDTCKRFEYDRATICADIDTKGQGVAGAQKLAQAMRQKGIAVRMVTPTGHKDLREWWQSGDRDIEQKWIEAGYR